MKATKGAQPCFCRSHLDPLPLQQPLEAHHGAAARVQDHLRQRRHQQRRVRPLRAVHQHAGLLPAGGGAQAIRALPALPVAGATVLWSQRGALGWQQPPYLSRHCAARQAVLRAALTWLSQRQLSSRLSQRSMLSEASLQASTSLMKLSCSGRPLGGRENGVRGLAGLVLGGWGGRAGCRMARSP